MKPEQCLNRIYVPCPVHLLLILIFYFAGIARLEANPEFNGDWIIDYELSDDTDRQVELAIKAAGGKISRSGKTGRGRYRGGPDNQKLYDHISYDETLRFVYTEPEFRLEYDDGFERVFYSDGRGRVASASGKSQDERPDHSFASWDGARLLVESRPHDGGRIAEVYTLEEAGNRLKIQLELQPLSFRVPIEITRIYNRRTVPE